MDTWSEVDAAMDKYGEQLAPKLQELVIESCAERLEAAFRVSDVKQALRDEAAR
ncbi:hypothetical protein [Mycobacteroides abscessus]|uniref:hypothetical protein n=1 Tax=Mycobacteroides abscessus TaxID=36809 RepID=UPI00092BEFBE|nr:hypothetical protein [Mycobacteroides abscessus]SIC58763.1 Uncharacterised protein [Mycobacteroides abscessus subsp. abscessus]